MVASPKIYEAHVGMSSKEPKVATYLDFAETVIPRIKRMPGDFLGDPVVFGRFGTGGVGESKRIMK